MPRTKTHRFTRLIPLALATLCMLATQPFLAHAAETIPASAPAPALPSTLIELDGSSSVSPDGGELTFRWTQLSGPKIELSDPAAAKPYFRTSQPGIYEFELIVEANGLQSEPHLVRLEIERENLPPTAKLIPEAWGQVGKAMELDAGTSTDPEGEPLTYRWRSLTPGLELPPDALDKPRLVFEPTTDGIFQIELTVSDGEKASLPVVSRVTIRPRPKPPIAKVEVKTLKATIPSIASIPSDVAAMAPPAPLTPPTPAPVSALKPQPPAQPQTQTPEMSAPVLPLPPATMASANSSAATPTAPAAIPTPAPAPAAPRARATTIAPELLPLAAPLPPFSPAPGARPQTTPVPAPLMPPVARIEGPVVAKAGETVTLDARGSLGTTGNRLEYLWRQTSGAFINDFELVFDGAAERFKAPRPGDYEFELSVVDSGVESAAARHSLKVVAEEDPPVAVIVAPTRAMPGALVKMDATQSYDMAGSPLIYRWRQTGGPAVKNYVIDETLGDAAPAFHPPTAGVYSFELVVSNGKRASKPIEIDIEVGDARVPPGFAVSGPEAANAGERIAWDVAVANDDARQYVFEWRQNEGPANALVQSQGARALVMAPIPGRYVFDVTMKNRAGETLTASKRTLEVFKNAVNGANAANSTAGRAPSPLVRPPSPVQPPQTAAPRQRRVVPELTPLPNTPAARRPAPASFPPPEPARQAAKILQR